MERALICRLDTVTTVRTFVTLGGAIGSCTVAVQNENTNGSFHFVSSFIGFLSTYQSPSTITAADLATLPRTYAHGSTEFNRVAPGWATHFQLRIALTSFTTGTLSDSRRLLLQHAK